MSSIRGENEPSFGNAVPKGRSTIGHYDRADSEACEQAVDYVATAPSYKSSVKSSHSINKPR